MPVNTPVRAKLSEKSKYYIDKHRYYELKHFCLQYPLWKKLYSETDGYRQTCNNAVAYKDNAPVDPTFKFAERRSLYFEKMEMVEQSALAADPGLVDYILVGVTEGVSYANLKSRLGIPCGKDTYYDRYRRFFWLLDQARG